jgi:hypothetical protein
MDALASLRPSPIQVEAGGWRYTIPALPASTWIEAVLDTDGAAIFPGLLEREAYREAMADYFAGRLSGEEITEAGRACLEAAAGRSWWVADRLIRGAADKDAWPIVYGELVGRVDLDKVSVAAFCDAVYALAVGRLTEEKARAQFDFELTNPPAGVSIEEIYDQAEAAADFMAALGQDATLPG